MQYKISFYIGIASFVLTITALSFTVGKPHYMKHHGHPCWHKHAGTHASSCETQHL